jgi:hypothetical protein
MSRAVQEQLVSNGGKFEKVPTPLLPSSKEKQA